MSFKFSKTSIRRMKGLNQKLIDTLHCALANTRVDFMVVSGLRTAEEQNKLYKQGKSYLDGYNRKSAHQLGLAVDIVPYVDGHPVWSLVGNEDKWLEIGRAMLRCARRNGICLEWGLTYNINGGHDPYHFEIKGEL